MGDPSIPYPFKYFEKISHIPKRKMANIPKSRKHCIPISLELIKISCIPLNIYKNIPYPFMLLAHIPVSLKPLPGLTICCFFVPKYLIKYSKNTQKDQNLVFKTDYHLNAGQSDTEGSERSILQYFRASLSYHSSLKPVVVHF